MAGKETTTLSKRTLRLIREMKEKAEGRAQCLEEGRLHAEREAVKAMPANPVDSGRKRREGAGSGGPCPRCLILWGKRNPNTGVRRGVCRRCGAVRWYRPRKAPAEGTAG